MNTAHPYDLVIGLDRSDKKADLCLINTHTGQRRSEIIHTTPEALWEWLLALRQQFPQARVGLCLEQPAVHLIPLPGALRLDHAPSHQSPHPPEISRGLCHQPRQG